MIDNNVFQEIVVIIIPNDDRFEADFLLVALGHRRSGKSGSILSIQNNSKPINFFPHFLEFSNKFLLI